MKKLTITILIISAVILSGCLAKPQGNENIVNNSKQMGIINFSIPELKIKVSFPNNYSLLKNGELNRRGSFLSYDFQQSGDYQTPNFSELQFFSDASIKNFLQNCEKDALCFEGDYSNLESYTGQKEAFKKNIEYQGSKLKEFNSRDWFVSNNKCRGDSCVIREYTTFIGDIKFDVLIDMASPTEEKRADILFSQFRIE